jgi:F420-dependent oxidoreductase-like protein
VLDVVDVQHYFCEPGSTLAESRRKRLTLLLSSSMNYAGDPLATAALTGELERAGLDMVWIAEGYSFDAVSLLGFIAARTERIELATGIMPIYSRTPALIASTAAGLDALSEGRFILGLGASGPQVIEGWHGVPYDRPLQRTREIVDICRTVWRRERLSYAGKAYQLPLPASEGTGLGKPLKLVNHPVRERIPIYVASLGARNVQLTAEIAEGWLPTFFHPDRAREVWQADLETGYNKRDPALAPLEVVAGGTVHITPDADEAERLRDRGRPMLALYVGGMGAAGRNFYNALFARYGYQAEAAAIQQAYLAGNIKEAENLIPADYLRATSMIGDEGWIRERIAAYREAGVTRLSVSFAGAPQPATVEKLREWCG